MPVDPAKVSGWAAAPMENYLHDGDPRGNALSGDSLSPSSMPQPYQMTGKHGEVYPNDPPNPDGYCLTPDGGVPNAADPNTGNASGINPGPFAKG